MNKKSTPQPNNTETTGGPINKVTGIEKKYYSVQFNKDSKKYISEPVLIKKSDFEKRYAYKFFWTKY
ncbi:MAG: hypothetical protein GX895_09850 [Clostridiales bacterium]|nr:hypothetical protein [Clostridiales bacterium]